MFRGILQGRKNTAPTANISLNSSLHSGNSIVCRCQPFKTSKWDEILKNWDNAFLNFKAKVNLRFCYQSFWGLISKNGVLGGSFVAGQQ